MSPYTILLVVALASAIVQARSPPFIPPPAPPMPIDVTPEEYQAAGHAALVDEVDRINGDIVELVRKARQFDDLIDIDIININGGGGGYGGGLGVVGYNSFGGGGYGGGLGGGGYNSFGGGGYGGYGGYPSYGGGYGDYGGYGGHGHHHHHGFY